MSTQDLTTSRDALIQVAQQVAPQVTGPLVPILNEILGGSIPGGALPYVSSQGDPTLAPLQEALSNVGQVAQGETPEEISYVLLSTSKKSKSAKATRASTAAAPSASWGVKFSYGSTSWYLTLLPAMRTALPLQGGYDTPQAMPGLSIRAGSNLAKHRTVGFQPIYQHLGVDSVLITMVGLFTGGDGSRPAPFTYASTNPISLGSRVAASDAYASFAAFYELAVLKAHELTIEINMDRTRDLQSAPAKLTAARTINALRNRDNGNPKFKGLLHKMEVYAARTDRVWYLMEFEVTDLGLLNSKPVKLTNLVEKAIKAQQVVKPNSAVVATCKVDQVLSLGSDWRVVTYGDVPNTVKPTKKAVAYSPSSCQLRSIFVSDGKYLCDSSNPVTYTGKAAIDQIVNLVENNPDANFISKVTGSPTDDALSAIREFLRGGDNITYAPGTPPFSLTTPLDSQTYKEISGPFLDQIFILESGRIVTRGRLPGSTTRELSPREALSKISNADSVRAWINSSSNVVVCAGATSSGTTATASGTATASSTSNQLSPLINPKVPLLNGYAPNGQNLTFQAAISPYMGKSVKAQLVWPSFKESVSKFNVLTLNNKGDEILYYALDNGSDSDGYIGKIKQLIVNGNLVWQSTNPVSSAPSSTSTPTTSPTPAGSPIPTASPTPTPTPTTSPSAAPISNPIDPAVARVDGFSPRGGTLVLQDAVRPYMGKALSGAYLIAGSQRFTVRSLSSINLYRNSGYLTFVGDQGSNTVNVKLADLSEIGINSKPIWKNLP